MNAAKAAKLVALAAAFKAAKDEESAAKEKVKKAAAAILRHTGFQKPEGQETFTGKNAEFTCKVEINQPVNTTIDDTEWKRIRATLDKNHPGRKVILPTFKLDKKAAGKLQDEKPDLWNDIAPALSRKPGKISVKLLKIEPKE